ncbi:protein mono-ADP-ribosyltransferase PARP14 [Nothobranchius furzeri]|uniref:Poly [ADP-ribose] polymerase n=4 Tax=Nothobranchius furzeri TaxID=105023 RepID=A0A1A8A986_NOTFU
MGDTELPPVTVEGDWSPDQNRTMKNKLQIYFQSKKKSSGGDCRVEAEDGAPRAAVFFRSEAVRDRVLARKNHEILLENRTLILRLSSGLLENPTSSDGDSDPKIPKSEPEPEPSATKRNNSKSTHRPAVVLENVSENLTRDLLLMLVENISKLDEHNFSLEIIWESKMAVVIFNNPADVEKFIPASQNHSTMRKHGLSARALEAATGVRVEGLPQKDVKDLLELWFEKHWVLPDKVLMVPEEQAAIVTFGDPKDVEDICRKEDHIMRSIPVKLYPYYESLGTALYGKGRPSWKMPDSFTVKVHPVIWKFLLMKGLLGSINDQMHPHFCSVALDDPEVELSPLPSLLRQKGLTAKDVAVWSKTAREAFCRLMSQYSAFECDVNTDAWKSAEKEVHLVVKEDAILVFDASKEVLIVAGRADDIKTIRAPVENIVLKAASAVERSTKAVSETMLLSPERFYILKHEGLLKAASDISSEMELSYNEGTQTLTIKGLTEEVLRTKNWILEKNTFIMEKQLNIPQGLLQYLGTMDPVEMSKNLFASHNISAVFRIDSNRVTLTGSSGKALADAESKMKADLLVRTLDVKDATVLTRQEWTDLNKELLDTFNSSDRRTVNIWVSEGGGKVTVAGFVHPVKEVCSSLNEFIKNYSQVQESIRVESCAVVQFIERKKSDVWLSIAKDHGVSVKLDPERPKIVVGGARLHVQRAKSCLRELAGALCAGTLTVDKPGAKKYFLSQGHLFLSSALSELGCVVVLRPEIQDEEEDEEEGEEEDGVCYCSVRTSSRVVVSVSRADICSLKLDAVVNAANEDLQHIGGLALAMLKAAGPQLQKISNDHVAKKGKVQAGKAVLTDAFNLPCRYVVHAVGPRFSEYDRRTSVSRLKSAVRESLRQAEMVNCSTIALPAISSGVFGFPVPLCTETIAQAVRDYCDSPQGPRSLTEIHLVDNNSDTVRVMAAAVKKEFSDLEPTMSIPKEMSRKSKRAAGGHQRGGGSPSKSPSSQGAGRGGFQGDHQVNRGVQRSYSSEDGGSGRMEQITPDGLKIVLRMGNIQNQSTDVIVNTIADNMDLTQGAVSRAIVEAAGDQLQVAVYSESETSTRQHGDVVITDGFNLRCRKVFHAVCPPWDGGGGQAEKDLSSIITSCLEQAERRRMASLCFPAIGTGNLGFPRELVIRILLEEIQVFSRRRSPQHLEEVVIMVHPSDQKTVDSFTRGFSGQTGQRNVQHEDEEDFSRSAAQRASSHGRNISDTFSPVLSPSLGVYQMQMGQLTLEVSSGDITKEACEVIVNSSNQKFDLYAGVSKAILDSAGVKVQQECSAIVSAQGYMPRAMILTSAGQLPSRNILHIVGQNDPSRIKEMVYGVLKFCEDHKFSSVAFPALGTGQGGASPSAVADAMVGAVVDFVRKKKQKFVCSVKILIFQTIMIKEFYSNMRKRSGEEVEKGLMGKIKDFFGIGSEQQRPTNLVLEKEEFEAAVFQLCAETETAVSEAKKRISNLILAEQAKKTISDQLISQFSHADVEELQSLQKELTVNIRLETGREDQESKIHLEGLTRDVFKAESAIRDIIRKVEKTENMRSRAKLVSKLVEWQYQDPNGSKVPFDIITNLQLEDALDKHPTVKIKIGNKTFIADPKLKKAYLPNGQNQLELLRKDLKVPGAPLPPHWEDMKGDIVKLFPVTVGTTEYNTVMGEITKNGLAPNVISVERVQNTTLWQSFQLLKKQMEVKNNHANNERLLFHGTASKSTDLINSKGFNRSYAGIHGAMYGKGSYFAVDPAYSAGNYAKPDSKGHKRMYQARVLVGDYTQGSGTMITPPAKSTNPADLYDSVTDRANNPSMFVVFNDIQAYPEYLITFT